MSRNRYNSYCSQSPNDQYNNRSMSRNRYNSYCSQSPSDRYNTRNRSQSRNRSNDRFSRPQSRNRSRNRFNRSANCYDRSNSRNRDFNNSSTRIRNRSLSIRRFYPDFKPGFNCREDYDINKKSCSKCNDYYNTPKHHEFECGTFTKYSKTPCPSCRRGNHTENECNKLYTLN